jgi:hypothetical protein
MKRLFDEQIHGKLEDGTKGILGQILHAIENICVHDIRLNKIIFSGGLGSAPYVVDTVMAELRRAVEPGMQIAATVSALEAGIVSRPITCVAFGLVYLHLAGIHEKSLEPVKSQAHRSRFSLSRMFSSD